MCAESLVLLIGSSPGLSGSLSRDVILVNVGENCKLLCGELDGSTVNVAFFATCVHAMCACTHSLMRYLVAHFLESNKHFQSTMHLYFSSISFRTAAV
jgi:hypothetical protein